MARQRSLRMIALVSTLLLPAVATAQGRPDIRWMRGGHAFEPIVAAYAPNGLTIVSGSQDGTVKVWRRSDGQLLRTIRAHTTVTAIAVHPGSEIVASGGYGDEGLSIKVWRADGTLLWRRDFSSPHVRSLAFTPDGATLVSAGGCNEGTCLWRTGDGAPDDRVFPGTFGIHGTGYGLAISSDGKWLATSTWAYPTIRVFNLNDPSDVRTFGQDSGGGALALSADGSTIVSGHGLGVTVWRLRDAVRINPTSGIPIAGDQYPIDRDHPFYKGVAGYQYCPADLPCPARFGAMSVAFSPDGSQFAAGGSVNLGAIGPSTVRVFSTGTGTLLHEERGVDDRPLEGARALVAYAPDASGELAVFAGHIKLWDTTDWSVSKNITIHSGSRAQVGFARGGQWVVSIAGWSSRRESIYVWDAATGVEVRRIPLTGSAYASAMSDDGALIAVVDEWRDIDTGQRRSRVAVYNVEDGSTVRTIDESYVGGTEVTLAFSHDASVLGLSAGNLTYFRLSPSRSPCLAGIADGSSPMHLSYPGRFLWRADDCALLIGSGSYDLRWGSPLTSFTPAIDYPMASALSADGRYYAVGGRASQNGEWIDMVNVWSVSDGALAGSFAGIARPVRALAFTPANDYIVAGIDDATVRFWHLPSAQETFRYDEETGNGVRGHLQVQSVVFSPGGELFAYSRIDATFVVARSPVGPPLPPSDTTPPAIAVPDPVVVEATGPDGAVVTWPTPTATDDTDGNPPVVCSADSGAAFPLGTTTVTCQATDAAGNAATATFIVSVQDTTPPSLANIPANQTLDATGAGGTIASWPQPAALDIVDGAVPTTCTPTSGALFSIGTTTVMCSAVDAHGNRATASFTVHVKGADEQLADLEAAVTGIGPGTSLRDKVRAMRAALASGDVATACGTLRALAKEATAQAGKKLTSAQAAAIVASVGRMRGVIGCG